MTDNHKAVIVIVLGVILLFIALFYYLGTQSVSILQSPTSTIFVIDQMWPTDTLTPIPSRTPMPRVIMIDPTTDTPQDVTIATYGLLMRDPRGSAPYYAITYWGYSQNPDEMVMVNVCIANLDLKSPGEQWMMEGDNGQKVKWFGCALLDMFHPLNSRFDEE